MSRGSATIRAIGMALAMGALLSACGKDPKPVSAGPSSKPQTLSPQEKVASTMVAAVSSSKTAAAVGVHFALESPPVVGKPLGVEIAFLPRQAFAGLRVVFTTPEALILAIGDRFDATAVEAASVLTHKVVVQPKEEGVFLITAAVETEGEEGTLTRLYSIPIIVYGAPAPAAAKPSGLSQARPTPAAN